MRQKREGRVLGTLQVETDSDRNRAFVAGQKPTLVTLARHGDMYGVATRGVRK